jgi:hypothetical protein
MYRHVAVFTLAGDFLGFGIKEDGAQKLQSTHLYPEDTASAELTARLAELNTDRSLQQVWPDARDPEVQALVNDPNFEPIEMVDEDVIDMDRSYIVYIKDPEGGDTLDVDNKASVINYKKARIPARPSDFFTRTKKAQEQVARSRLS